MFSLTAGAAAGAAAGGGAGRMAEGLKTGAFFASRSLTDPRLGGALGAGAPGVTPRLASNAAPSAPIPRWTGA